MCVNVIRRTVETIRNADQDEFSLLKVLEETSGREMPQAIKDILNANILHDLECDADKMKDTVKNILEV